MNTRTQVPRRQGGVLFGPVSQVDIQASPERAESRDDIPAMLEACQAVADEFRLPVVFACETPLGVGRHTFQPKPN